MTEQLDGLQRFKLAFAIKYLADDLMTRVYWEMPPAEDGIHPWGIAKKEDGRKIVMIDPDLAALDAIFCALHEAAHIRRHWDRWLLDSQEKAKIDRDRGQWTDVQKRSARLGREIRPYLDAALERDANIVAQRWFDEAYARSDGSATSIIDQLFEVTE